MHPLTHSKVAALKARPDTRRLACCREADEQHRPEAAPQLAQLHSKLLAQARDCKPDDPALYAVMQGLPRWPAPSWQGLLKLLCSHAVGYMDSCSPASPPALEHVSRALWGLHWAAQSWAPEPGCRSAVEGVFKRAAEWLGGADWGALGAGAAGNPRTPTSATRVLHAWGRAPFALPPPDIVAGLAAAGAAGAPGTLAPKIAAALFENLAALVDRYVNLAREEPHDPDSPKARLARLATIRAEQAARGALRRGIAGRLDGALAQAVKTLQGGRGASPATTCAPRLVRLAHALGRLQLCPGAGAAGALAGCMPGIAPHLNLKGVVVLANLVLFWRARGLAELVQPAGVALNARCARAGRPGPWLEPGIDLDFFAWVHGLLDDTCPVVRRRSAVEGIDLCGGRQRPVRWKAPPRACSAGCVSSCIALYAPEYLATAADED